MVCIALCFLGGEDFWNFGDFLWGLLMAKDESTPKLAEWEDERVQLAYRILCDNLANKPGDEHWEGYCARWIVGELVDRTARVSRAFESVVKALKAYRHDHERDTEFPDNCPSGEDDGDKGCFRCALCEAADAALAEQAGLRSMMEIW